MDAERASAVKMRAFMKASDWKRYFARSAMDLETMLRCDSDCRRGWMRERRGVVFAEQKTSDDRIARPFAAIRFDAVDDAEDEVHDPAAAPEKPDQRNKKHKGRRWFARLVRNAMRRVRDSAEHRDKENRHCAEAEDQISRLPNQRLQRVIFHKLRILLDDENHERADEAAENLQKMREHRHRAFVFCRLAGRSGLPIGGVTRRRR